MYTIHTSLCMFSQNVDEVGDQYRIAIWFQLLANSSFVRNQLLYYDAILTTEDNGFVVHIFLLL